MFNTLRTLMSIASGVLFYSGQGNEKEPTIQDTTVRGDSTRNHLEQFAVVYTEDCECPDTLCNAVAAPVWQGENSENGRNVYVRNRWTTTHIPLHQRIHDPHKIDTQATQ